MLYLETETVYSSFFKFKKKKKKCTYWHAQAKTKFFLIRFVQYLFLQEQLVIKA